ncbi:MAG: BatD family protein [Saprospiraceae bacterium]
MKTCWLLLWGILAWGGLLAQPTFTAYSDAKDVLLGNYFELTFTLENGEGSQFTPPDLSDFMVLSGPNAGYQTSIINGFTSVKQTFNYHLQPKKTGTFTIGSALIKVKQNTLSTRPLSIRVHPNNADPNADKPELLIQARVSHETAYLGQQLMVDYVLYNRVDVEALNASEESDYAGFFMREIHRFDNRTVREVIQGVQYTGRIIKQVAIYPQQTGQLTISPLSIIAGVPMQRSGAGGFFGRTELRRVPVTSNALTVNVLPLPHPQPEHFSDITGQFSLSAVASRQQITTDDALSLTLTFEGKGDLKRVQAPELSLPADAFEVYDPKVVSEEYMDLPNNPIGKKVFEYLLVPLQPGAYTLQPKVVVFQPDTAAYQELTVPAIQVQVKPGSGKKSTGLVAEAADEENVLLPPTPTMRPLSVGSDLLTHPLYWLFFLLPVGVMAGFHQYRRYQDQHTTTDPLLLKKEQALARAKARLQQAASFQHPPNARAFYEAVERALLGYISDKLQIPRADFTKAHVNAKLTEIGATPAQTATFNTLIQNCEMALYAGMDNAAAMDTTYTQTLDLLAEMEEVL